MYLSQELLSNFLTISSWHPRRSSRFASMSLFLWAIARYRVSRQYMSAHTGDLLSPSVYCVAPNWFDPRHRSVADCDLRAQKSTKLRLDVHCPLLRRVQPRIDDDRGRQHVSVDSVECFSCCSLSGTDVLLSMFSRTTGYASRWNLVESPCKCTHCRSVTHSSSIIRHTEMQLMASDDTQERSATGSLCYLTHVLSFSLFKSRRSSPAAQSVTRSHFGSPGFPSNGHSVEVSE